MGDQIIDLQDFFQTPQGRYLLEWERAQMDRTVADIFGYHALQLGMPGLRTLLTNRMPHRWVAHSIGGQSVTPSGMAPMAAHGSTQTGPGQTVPGESQTVDLLCDFAALPFAANSLDLVVLPHTLELDADPHATLREVERVLVPEGRVVICGVNPASLWGLRQRRAHLYRRLGYGDLFLPREGEFIGYWRLRDWLRLLSFEVESGRFGCYRPAVVSEQWLDRFHWMDRVGERWWPIFGAVYFVVAVKRVRGMRLLGPVWKTAPALANAPVSVANSVHATPAEHCTSAA
ncbi:MAG: methyltransferase domain-containing protein [Burkholderiaceae bacterium]